MPSRVRDLEQLEEHDPDGHGKKLGNVVMALVSVVGLAFAIAYVVNSAAEGGGVRDPLDQLERLAEASREREARKPTAPLPRPVEASDLTFERRLIDSEERPEVLAALAAAGREEADLALRDAELDRELRLGAPDEPIVHERRGRIPAAITAGAAHERLEKTRKHDRLVDEALPEPSAPRAAIGHEGEYTLQVISYDTRPAAEAFATELRARGHEAFVSTVDVDGRGRSYRVRVGPFKTKQSADDYRKQFESRERMNTIVVKRPKDV